MQLVVIGCLFNKSFKRLKEISKEDAVADAFQVQVSCSSLKASTTWQQFLAGRKSANLFARTQKPAGANLRKILETGGVVAAAESNGASLAVAFA